MLKTTEENGEKDMKHSYYACALNTNSAEEDDDDDDDDEHNKNKENNKNRITIKMANTKNSKNMNLLI